MPDSVWRRSNGDYLGYRWRWPPGLFSTFTKSPRSRYIFQNFRVDIHTHRLSHRKPYILLNLERVLIRMQMRHNLRREQLSTPRTLRKSQMISVLTQLRIQENMIRNQSLPHNSTLLWPLGRITTTVNLLASWKKSHGDSMKRMVVKHRMPRMTEPHFIQDEIVHGEAMNGLCV